MQLKTILAQILAEKGWTQTQLGKELKVTQPTVSRWFEGSEPKVNHLNRIMSLARKLGIVEPGVTTDDLTIPIVGYVGAGGQILYDEGQGPFGEARMPPKDATSTTVAVIVRGDSMAGLLEDGWTVYYDSRHTPPTPPLFGRLCVVGLADGRVLIKKLHPGRQKGCFDLYSANAAPMLDQAVAWAARVSWIAPT